MSGGTVHGGQHVRLGPLIAVCHAPDSQSPGYPLIWTINTHVSRHSAKDELPCRTLCFNFSEINDVIKAFFQINVLQWKVAARQICSLSDVWVLCLSLLVWYHYWCLTDANGIDDDHHWCPQQPIINWSALCDVCWFSPTGDHTPTEGQICCKFIALFTQVLKLGSKCIQACSISVSVL